MNAKLPDGQYLIPSAQSSAPYQYGVPNVNLIGTSVLTADQATDLAGLRRQQNDRLSVKYYYQNDSGLQALRLLSDRRISGDAEQRIAGRCHRQHHLDRLPPELGTAPGLRRMGSYSYLQPDACRRQPGNQRRRRRLQPQISSQDCPVCCSRTSRTTTSTHPALSGRSRTAPSSIWASIRTALNPFNQRDLHGRQAHHRGRRRLQLYAAEYRPTTATACRRSRPRASRSFLKGSVNSFQRA